MSLNGIWNLIVNAIQNIGTVTFIILVIVDIILYNIHPVLGFLGTLVIFALLFGLI